MIVITFVLRVWKTEVLLTCSAAREAVGIAGASGEGDSSPDAELELREPCRVFVGAGGGAGFEKPASRLCHGQRRVSNSAFSSVPTRCRSYV